ncbi:NAD(P)-dependent oxidoreductase [Marivita hallyeonensis]|uniref:3-hydroxyisobutyrate dehydrogenase n=1 Tax=Marivita hallyeonensis TaxID=996342 RepID=A0A1M5RTZ6_9RHOB|nr:DUF1932 domain-containing protein [Marivita hallyeonensis]SHH29792.1 3-hydroxyisobutyrate dehydrogenase [Marivita hallyeonensis]
MKLAFIGFGEAGSAFVRGWGDAHKGAISAYDIKSADPRTAPEIAERAAVLNVENCADAATAVASADLVFCTVTADQAGVAARTAAPHLGSGTVWLDLNSCAPETKRGSAAVIEAAGGRYVDVAVMSPVYPKLNRVPCLISGPQAAALSDTLTELPMNVRVVSDLVGHASSIKMIRSVMVKGLEALISECVLAAHAAGVEDEVLTSLGKSYPAMDWPKRATYNFERMLVHGTRRAAEMEEVSKTLRDLGLFADVTEGTIAWQRRMAGLDVAPPDEEADLRTVATNLLAALRKD